MSDEQQLRELLSYVAEPPDHLQPPVQRLVELGRRHRSRRVVSWSAAVSAVAAVAIVAPSLALNLGQQPSASGPGHLEHPLFGPNPVPVASGPTAAELARYRWSELPKSPLGAGQPNVVAWAGTDLVEISREYHHDLSLTTAFDPVTGHWRPERQLPNDVDAAEAAVVWTGHRLFVTDARYPACDEPTAPVPGPPAEVCRPHAGLYNPVTNQWADIALPKVMYGLLTTSATWTGQAVVLTGIAQGRQHPRIVVAAYFPSTRRWQVITPVLPAGHFSVYATATATTDRLLLWVMWQLPHEITGKAYTGVDVLALGNTGGWQSVKGWPQNRSISNPAFTGSELLIPVGSTWCGSGCKQVGIPEPGFFADPVSLHRTLIPKTAVDSEYGWQYLWTGRAIIEINGQGASSQPPPRAGETLAYDPVARRWRELGSVPTGDFLTGVAWTGTELLALSHTGQLFALHR